MFKSDLPQVMQYFVGDYCASLNSDDCYDPELPLTSSKAHGGTMTMWRRSLDPYVTVHATESASIIPIIFEPPGLQASVHLTVYLPTAGR